MLHFPNLAKCASSRPHCICQLLWGLISIAMLEGSNVGEDCALFHTQCHSLTETDSLHFRKERDGD